MPSTSSFRAPRKSRVTAHAEKMAAIFSETTRILQGGACPRCGSGFRRNLALTGWWQCEQYGAPGFRADDAKPSCAWQGFTQD